MSRSALWYQVWDRRDPTLVELNGEEACFSGPEYRAFVEAEARLVTETLRIGPDDRLLDLGCGTGLLTSMVAPGARSVLALDYSHHALEVAQAKHALPNVEYRWADLGAVDPAVVDVDKAYAVSSFHYLDSYEVARALLAGLCERGVETVVLDVPDERFRSEMTRDYDTERWSHLCFDEAQIRADFPGSTVFRGRFPKYRNDAVRFSVHIPSATVSDGGPGQMENGIR